MTLGTPNLGHYDAVLRSPRILHMSFNQTPSITLNEPYNGNPI